MTRVAADALQERLVLFAVKIIDLAACLPKTTAGRHLAAHYPKNSYGSGCAGYQPRQGESQACLYSQRLDQDRTSHKLTTGK